MPSKKRKASSVPKASSNPDGSKDEAGVSAPLERATKTRKTNRKPRTGRSSIVKTSLKKHLLTPDITLPILDKAVHHVSTVSRVASMAMNLTLMKVLGDNNGVFPYFVDFTSITLFFQLFNLPIRGGAKAKNIHHFSHSVLRTLRDHAELFPDLQPMPNDGCLLTEASQTYQTVFINHHVLSLERRMATYVKLRLGDDAWSRLRGAKKAYQLMRFLTDGDWERPQHDVLTASEWAYLDPLRERYLRYAAARSGLTNTTTSIQLAVEMGYFLGMQIEEWKAIRSRERDEQQNPDRQNQDRQIPGSFSMAPVTHIKRHFVTFTLFTLERFFKTTAAAAVKDVLDCSDPLCGMLDRKGKKRKKVDGPPEKVKTSDAWWTALFTDDTFRLRSKKMGWEFDGRVQTDGVALCVAFRNLGQKVCSKSRFKKNCTCSGCRKLEWDEGMQYDRILANDPGDVNIAYVVEKDPRGKIHKSKLRNKEFYLQSDYYKRTNIMKKHMRRSQLAFDEVSGACVKTVDLERQLAYWLACTTHWDAMWKALYAKVHARMAFDVYRKRTSAMDRFWSCLKKGRKGKAIMLYGAGGSGSFSYRGKKCAPTSFAYKRCRKVFDMMFVVPEWYTSQYCPHCDVKIQDVRDDAGKVLRSVKRCSSSGCVERASKHHASHVRRLAGQGVCEQSRDEIGALNIWKCGVATMHGQQRPMHLTFAYNQA
jgi:hypothetical protein